MTAEMCGDYPRWLTPRSIIRRESIGTLILLRDGRRFIMDSQGFDILARCVGLTAGVIAELARLGMHVTVSTNATMLTDAVISLLLKSGVRGVQVSLDHCRPAAHDLIRGTPGAYDRALVGLSRAVTAGIPVKIVTTLTGQSPKEYADTIDLAASLGAGAHKTNALIPMGRGARLYKDIAGEASDVEPFRLIWADRRRRYQGAMTVEGEQAFLIATGVLEDDTSLPGPFRVGCTAGILTCSVDPRGQLLPCSFFTGYHCADLTVDDFARSWNDSPELRVLRNRSSFEGQCAGCAMLANCGGCRARAFSLTGRATASDPLCPQAK